MFILKNCSILKLDLGGLFFCLLFLAYMYYINCHCTHCNVDKCQRKNKEESIVVVSKVHAHATTLPRPLMYPCHIFESLGIS